MDRFTEKQQKIAQRATQVMDDYPVLWSQMIYDWCQPGSEDRAWLMYSANYLFHTANIRWTIDPLLLRHKLPDAPEMPVDGLKDLDFILLTHQHSDHLDLNLLRRLQDFSILCVVPAPLLPIVKAEVDIAADMLIVPEPMRTIKISGLRITPFEGLHWETQPDIQTLRGVPAMGYLIECHGKRWLFPGDTRTYDRNQLPSFGPVDVLFAHVWLGRGYALQDDPPLLEAFCRFCLDLQPKQIFLTHLDEFGRDANEHWDSDHAQKVISRISEKNPDISISPAFIGDRINL